MARKIELLPPFFIDNLISDRLNRLNQVLQYKEDRLKKAPSGSLNISVSNGRFQFYHIDSGPKTYLSAADNDLKKQLAQKEYDKNAVQIIKKNAAAFEKMLQLSRQIQKNDEELQTKLHPKKIELVQQQTLTDADFTTQWQNISYERNLRHSENLKFTTRRGEKVRSKSELLIADILMQQKVPYRYEFPVTVSVNTKKVKVYPDFCCLNVRTRQEIYWEHFGLMDNPEYAENAIRKLNEYTFANLDFVATFETKNQPLQSSLVLRQIKRYLK